MPALWLTHAVAAVETVLWFERVCDVTQTL